MKVKTKEYEIFVNGKFVTKADGIKNFQVVKDKIIQEYRDKGYERLESCKGIYDIMANTDKGDAVFIAYRQWFGFYDNNGEKIYDGDRLKADVEGIFTISQHYDREGEYYYRIHPYTCNKFYDTEINSMDFIKELNVVVDKKIYNF